MKKALLILVILVLAVICQGRVGLAESNGPAADAVDQADCSESAAEGDQGDSSESAAIEARPGYQTLRGQIYDIGTGEVPMLVFKAETGDYLVTAAGAGSAGRPPGAVDNTGTDNSQDAAENVGDDNDNDDSDYAGGDASSVTQKKLGKLKGLPLLLTGRVSLFDGGSFSGQLEVEDYNTYNDSSQDSSGDNSSEEDCESTWEEVAILGRLVAGENSLVLLSKDQVVIELEPDSYHSLGDYLEEEVVITGSLELLAEFRGQLVVKTYQVLSGD